MTWTCKECGQENYDSIGCMRTTCPSRKPAGMSEEERAALLANNAGCEAAGWPNSIPWSAWGEDSKRWLMAMYRASCAPLKAELTTLRERVRELEAMAVVAADKAKSDLLSAIAETESVQRQLDMARTELREAHSHIDTRLSHAQKPAAPAGLPEVGTKLEAEWEGKWETGCLVATESPDIAGPCVVIRLSGHRCVCARPDREGISWRRLPPAQTSREPTKRKCRHGQGTVCVACGEPTISPPGEVSTETPNLDGYLTRMPLIPGRVRDYAQADIRAAVEREREKWEDRIDDYNQRIEADQEHAEFLQNELRQALERGDAALVEVDTVKKQMGAECGAKHDALAEVEAMKKTVGILEAEKVDAAVANDKLSAEAERLKGERDTYRRDAQELQSRQLRNEAEIERLNRELELTKAQKRCPADGMSDLEVCRQLEQAGYLAMGPAGENTDTVQNFVKRARAMTAKARELFSPSKGATVREERRPQVGDTVWTVAVDVDGITPAPRCEPREDKVTDDYFMTENRHCPRRVCDLGKTWWWSDPSKGAE